MKRGEHTGHYHLPSRLASVPWSISSSFSSPGLFHSLRLVFIQSHLSHWYFTFFYIVERGLIKQLYTTC